MKILKPTEVTLYSTSKAGQTKILKVSPANRADHLFQVRELQGATDEDGHPCGGAFEILGTQPDCGWTLTKPAGKAPAKADKKAGGTKPAA